MTVHLYMYISYELLFCLDTAFSYVIISSKFLLFTQCDFFQWTKQAAARASTTQGSGGCT